MTLVFNAMDEKRVLDIISKSNGDLDKMLRLAGNMAKSIKEYGKAEGRCMAAVKHLGIMHPMVDIFRNRALELNPGFTHVDPKYDLVEMEQGEKIEPIIEEPQKDPNTLYLSSYSAIALWNMEFTGQISDGMWENSRPYDHYKVWCGVKTKFGRPGGNLKEYPRKTSYNFGALKKYIGNRMLVIGKFGKASGKDVFNFINSEVRCTIEDLPLIGPVNLEVWKAERIKKSDWRKAEYYWKGLTQELIDKYYNTVYTGKDLDNDIRIIKDSMAKAVNSYGI